MVYNFHRIRKQLDGNEAGLDWQWLEESYVDPENFWRELGNFHSSQLSTHCKSVLLEHYDFYHDLVIRNFQTDRIAFRWYERENGWQALSYRDLHSRVAVKAMQWESQGVSEGQIVCIIAHLGVKFLVSLLTSLKMGLCFSFLPPMGDYFIARRLAILGPNHIVTDYIYLSLLRGYEEIVLDDEKEVSASLDQSQHVYLPDDPVASLFSPLSTTSNPRPLSSEHAYLYALRDGLLAFSLNPGNHFAAPGFHALQHQPALLLACMMCGATYVHLSLEQIEENPELLDEFRLDTVGVTGALRDLLLKLRKKPLKKWRQWFKSPTDSLWQKWTQFVETLGLDKTPNSNVFFHAAAGGALLFSARTTEINHLQVCPLAGVNWKLVEPGCMDKESFGDYGIISTGEFEEDGSPLPAIMLARGENQWMYSGTTNPRRNGRTIPVDEILEVVNPLSFVEHSSIVPVTTGAGFGTYNFVLLVFTGFVGEDEIQQRSNLWIREINDEIQLHLGSEFLPDRTEFFPLYARETEGATDHNWCRDQYLTGGLHRKSRQRAFRLLTELRKALIIGKSPESTFDKD